jgi:hypothetical protein
MKIRDMVSMPHPPYSPDLAPCNFYLFSTARERTEHTSITDKDQLFEELHLILRSIPGEELEKVFKARRERIQNVNQGYGGHIDK